MDFEHFRDHAHQFVDWMAEYLGSMEQLPVRAQTAPGAILDVLPTSAPEAGEAMSYIFDDFKRIILPGVTHWQHPRFFAYFPANSSPPSVLAEMLTATLAAQCMLWETSPAANELETRMLGWLGELIGLPEDFTGSLQDSGSSSNLVALLAARERASEGAVAIHGLSGLPPLAIYTSEEAHSSIEKAAKVLGVGARHVRKIAIDDQQAMRPEELASTIARDRAAGIIPTAVVACIGATGLGSVDPLAEIGQICSREGIYLHVDAAWAGSALILPELRHYLAGIEHVDSFVLNPHKWLFTNFDCSALYMREPAALARALAANPAYLVSPDGATMPEYRDWGVPLARRFRALKLWFVLRSYGAETLRSMIRNHIAWTNGLAQQIREEPTFELVAGPRFALVAFRFCPDGVTDETAIDLLNEQLLAKINSDGRTYLTRTTLNGRPVIRFSIGQTYTEARHVQEGWNVVRELAAGLMSSTAEPS